MQQPMIATAPNDVTSSCPWLFSLQAPARDNAWESDALAASLEQVGQTTPLLAAREGQELLLVDGCKRLEILRQLGRQVLVLVVRASDPAARGLQRLAANQAWLLARQAPAMLLPALRFFLAEMDSECLQQRLPPLLGLEPRAKAWRLLLRWCEEIPSSSPWQRHLLAGRVHLADIDFLQRFGTEGRQALEPFFRELSWSSGGSRQFLSMLLESAQKEGRSVADLINEAGMQKISDAGLSPRDAMAALLGAARALRSPVETALRRRFENLGRELAAGTAWKLQPEQHFEADAVYLSARITSREQLLRAAGELQQMAEAPDWDSLCKLAGEDD